MSSADEQDTDALVQVLRGRGVDDGVIEQVRRLLREEGSGSSGDTVRSPTQNASEDTRLARPESLRQGDPAPDRHTRRREGPRLERVTLLARGGMGEVHRVHDAALDRHLAMKVLHEEFKNTLSMRARFLEEAQVTAQLTHPSIPPVHEIGDLPDGRPFFTMKEVHGHTLAARIEGLSATRGHERWSERRRLEIFQKVCEAVAYAHARGVVHCDLKPLNVMVGAFGEVLVMDWGVAVLCAPVGGLDEPPVTTSTAGAHTEAVAGTPAYMPPEQASGDPTEMGPAADVYALGVMLYELLSGVRPYGGNARQLFFNSVRGVVPPLPPRAGSIVDETLEGIIRRAMAPDPADRWASAAPLAEALAQWREGALRRDTALSWVREAEGTLTAIEPARERAGRLRDKARRVLGRLEENAPMDAKAEAWSAADEAISLEHAAELRTLEVTQRLVGALMHAPALAEAEALLARIHFERHRAAEARGDLGAAARHELRLRAYDRGEHAAYLTGLASLALETDPPSELRLFRYAQRDRRRVPEFVESLGTTPLRRDLPIGSYLLELGREDRPVVRYPVVLSRLEGWSGEAVWLPPAGAVAEEERYVPSGWFQSGDPVKRVWLERFVIQARPVSMADVARFLASPEGAGFRAQHARDGLEVRRADWPAVGLSWHAAVAYAAWWAELTGLAWRLPSEAEWEKAARGVDGRRYPFGDFADVSFCHARAGAWLPSAPVGVDAMPTDVSPYGVFGMAGNVREWCAEAVGEPRARARLDSGTRALDADELRVAAGGSYRQPLDACQVTSRVGLRPEAGYPDVGFRLVRPLPRAR
ncbi:MAG: bifunctional serine/threonine-protein kinase/formylglycine-generating enzyme family protein [Sandaracinaceae bacterium]